MVHTYDDNVSKLCESTDVMTDSHFVIYSSWFSVVNCNCFVGVPFLWYLLFGLVGWLVYYRVVLFLNLSFGFVISFV